MLRFFERFSLLEESAMRASQPMKGRKISKNIKQIVFKHSSNTNIHYKKNIVAF